MLSSQIPTKFPAAFASGATGSYIRPIPRYSQIGITDGAASLVDGFPPDTFSPVAAGGIPPSGADFNGLFNQVTAWLMWQSMGAAVPWDSVFSTAIAGYPLGAIVESATTAGKFWISTVENNVTNPDTGGAGWVDRSVVGGALTGNLPNPGLAAGSAATNVGALGGVLTGTLPNPGMAAGAAVTNIGFQPVQNGGLAGMYGNQVKLGWDAGASANTQGAPNGHVLMGVDANESQFGALVCLQELYGYVACHGGWRNIAAYGSSSTFVVPANISVVEFEICGGAGGGGGTGTNQTGGGGGAGGGYTKGLASVTPGQGIAVTIGTGGAGSAANGGAGGTTSFGSIAYATGGAGGNAWGNNGSGGAGGTGYGGYIEFTGQAGSDGGITSGFGGDGGSAGGFGGGNGRGGNGGGQSATSYGGGGGGGYTTTNSVPVSGGGGFSGLILLRW